MKIDQNPFSIYDFLGYLIPGIFFTYAVLIISKIDFFNLSITPLVSLELDQYLIIIILSYIVGHILSFISSITIESFAIWSLGYPSRYLLKCEFPGFWTNVIHEKRKLISIIKLLMVFFIFPVLLTDIIVRKVIKSTRLLGKPADELSISLLKLSIPQYLEHHFAIDDTFYPLDKKENDFFNIIYHYSLEESSAHITKMQNYVALYGFTRTLCFSFISLIWVIIFLGFGGEFSLNALITLLILTIISGFLYLDFNKFFRTLSLEAFMAFLSKFKKTGEFNHQVQQLDRTIENLLWGFETESFTRPIV